MDVHQRRQELAEARTKIAAAVFAVLAEAREQGEFLTTADIARRLEWTDYYDTLRDTLRTMKETRFVENHNEHGYYRQWSLADWMPLDWLSS